MLNSRCAARGFTLVEVLVVIAIVGLLVNFLVPSLQQARRTARIAICASNLHQQGSMSAQYVADTKGFLPMPGSCHALFNLNGGPTAAPTSPTGFFSTTSNTFNCPWGLRSYPNTIAWYWVMGYLSPPSVYFTGTKPKPNGVIPVMDCPEAPIGTAATSVNAAWKIGRTQMWAEEITYAEWTSYTKGCIEGGYANPQGGTWHDVGDAQSYLGYLNRGWWQNGVAHTKTMKADTAWKSTDPVTVDWWGDHGDGNNIQFYDGHVVFGDKSIGGVPAETWYTTFSGPNTGSGTVGLWKYYELGKP